MKTEAEINILNKNQDIVDAINKLKSFSKKQLRKEVGRGRKNIVDVVVTILALHEDLELFPFAGESPKFYGVMIYSIPEATVEDHVRSMREYHEIDQKLLRGEKL